MRFVETNKKRVNPRYFLNEQETEREYVSDINPFKNLNYDKTEFIVALNGGKIRGIEELENEEFISLPLFTTEEKETVYSLVMDIHRATMDSDEKARHGATMDSDEKARQISLQKLMKFIDSTSREIENKRIIARNFQPNIVEVLKTLRQEAFEGDLGIDERLKAVDKFRKFLDTSIVRFRVGNALGEQRWRLPQDYSLVSNYMSEEQKNRLEKMKNFLNSTDPDITPEEFKKMAIAYNQRQEQYYQIAKAEMNKAVASSRTVDLGNTTFNVKQPKTATLTGKSAPAPAAPAPAAPAPAPTGPQADVKKFLDLAKASPRPDLKRAYLQKVLQIDPNNQEAKQLLSQIQESKNFNKLIKESRDSMLFNSLIKSINKEIL